MPAAAPTVAAPADPAVAWSRWHEGRLSQVGGPFGQAGLRRTAWLTGRPATVDGAPGRWHAADGVVVGQDLGPAPAVKLKPGEHWDSGDLRLTAYRRDGQLALRVFTAANRLQDLAAHPFDPAWAVPATFVPDAATPAVTITSFDGYEAPAHVLGRFHFTLDGRPLSLTVTGPADPAAPPRLPAAAALTFSDPTNAAAGIGFRFLAIDFPPPATTTTTIDFNRAFLPPCAFSDQYLCPLPLAANRLPVAIPAGERHPVWEPA